MKVLAHVLLLFLSLRVLHAQHTSQAPVFDTVSIRPSNSASTSFGYNPNPNSFQAEGVTLGFLIQLAYATDASNIVSVPASFQNQKFDVLAKTDVDSASADAKLRYSSDEGRRLFQTRLQALLTDRFRLRLHAATAVRPVLNLQATSRSHLHPAVSKNPMQTSGPGYLRFDSMDMDGLAAALTAQLQTNVVNHTGLPGAYEIEVKWDVQANGESLSYPFSIVNDALNEQLGLRLVRAQAAVPILVVDNAASPTPN